jgi:predicted lipoprotein with Yx(FWY)xxD motif
MRTRLQRARLVVALVIGLAAVACGGASTSSNPAPSQSSPAPVVKTKTASVSGKSETVLADTKGLTLYYFTPDQGGKVTCTGACAANWPPTMLPSGVSRATGASGITGTLGTVTTPGGQQVTYNGWPLYTYVKDGDAGDVYGQGVGGKWFVAALNIPSATSGSPSPSGNGY